MLFSYKGINDEYKYSRGTVEANSHIDAMSLIKEKENIIVILSMKKVSNIKSLNRIRANVNNRLSRFENKLNERVRSSVQKENERKRERKAEEFNEPSTLKEKSPILRGINKLSSSIKNIGSNSGKRKVVMDEEMYSNIERMFRDRSDVDEVVERVTSQNTEMSLAKNKIENIERTERREKNKGKELDWSLLDGDESPEAQDNMKIKVKEKEIILFTRRLHIMLSSGVPLLSSLLLLQNTSGNQLNGVIQKVADDIQLGSSFSEAIAKFPRQFNYTYVALVSVGETSGSLEKSLRDIIRVKEQEQKISKKIKVASMYPIVIGIVLLTLMTAAFLYFIPEFEKVFEDQGVDMPAFSEVVFNIGRVFPYILGIGIIIVVIFIILKRNIPEVNYMYRRHVDKMMLSMPILKKVTNASYMFSFSSTIALMLDNGIRLSDTLSLTGKTINNIYIKSEIEDIANLMINGLTFSEAISEQEYFDEILTNIVMTGEKSGRMVFSLTQIAEYFEDELTRQIDSLLELVQPVSIILIGLVVAPIIVAAYLPILEMSSGSGIF